MTVVKHKIDIVVFFDFYSLPANPKVGHNPADSHSGGDQSHYFRGVVHLSGELLRMREALHLVDHLDAGNPDFC